MINLWFNGRLEALKKLAAPTFKAAAPGKGVAPAASRMAAALAAEGMAANVTTLKENVAKAIDEWAFIRGHAWAMPAQVAGTVDAWIEVDLSEHMLYVYRGGRLMDGFLVATGASGTPTITGSFRIYAKFPTYRMRGAGYDLPDVPYVMFFQGNYAIHGVYWHNSFGVSISHGCVNLLTADAAGIYEMVKIGTCVFVHG